MKYYLKKIKIVESYSSHEVKDLFFIEAEEKRFFLPKKRFIVSITSGEFHRISEESEKYSLTKRCGIPNRVTVESVFRSLTENAVLLYK